MADRSTAAVGVANEGGATSDGTTDDQTIGAADDDTGTTSSDPRPTTDTRPAAKGSKAAQQAETASADTGPKNGSRAGKPAAKAARDASGQADTPAENDTAQDGDSDRPEAAAPEAEAEGTDAAGTETADAETDSAGSPAGPRGNSGTETVRLPSKVRTPAPELHSGHKLARRYQLAECVTRVDGFSSWRAVDEKLRRAVGIHILPSDHDRARPVLAAARSAALLGDPRFVQVLDAVEDNDLVYVIHEWLPDATALSEMLAAGPLEPHEAYQMVSQVSQGMAAAHREGLAHLRLDPGAVLRTVSGQYRIRGLAVAAALRGLSSDRPQRQDTEAIGALLYASLTQRWPHEEDAHGLTGLPKGVGLIAPDQVRAGVHRGLSETAMRALANDGATASREEPPCTTPEELAKAVASIPRIRKPEHVQSVYQPPVFQQPPKPPGVAARQPMAPPPPPPTLPGRTGQALKLAVASLVIVAIGLGSWQLADTLKSRENRSANPTPTGQKAGSGTPVPASKPLTIVGAKDFDPFGDQSENPRDLPKAYDHDPATFWQSNWYTQADLGNLKPGVGLIVDLGSAQRVSGVKVDFIGQTSAQLLAAPSGLSTLPTAFTDFKKVDARDGTEVTFSPGKITTRYLLVWLTDLPPTGDGHFRGKIAEVHVTG